MKRLVFYLTSADGERVDRVTFEPGATLVDSSSTKRNSPLVNMSELVGVELLDDDAAADVTPIPTPLPETRDEGSTSVPVYDEGATFRDARLELAPFAKSGIESRYFVAVDLPASSGGIESLSPGTPSRWGALPLDEEPPDAA